MYFLFLKNVARKLPWRRLVEDGNYPAQEHLGWGNGYPDAPVLCTHDSWCVLERDCCQWDRITHEIHQNLISWSLSAQTSLNISMNNQNYTAKTQMLLIRLLWAMKRQSLEEFMGLQQRSEKWQNTCNVGKHEVSCKFRRK